MKEISKTICGYVNAENLLVRMDDVFVGAGYTLQYRGNFCSQENIQLIESAFGRSVNSQDSEKASDSPSLDIYLVQLIGLLDKTINPKQEFNISITRNNEKGIDAEIDAKLAGELSEIINDAVTTPVIGIMRIGTN